MYSRDMGRGNSREGGEGGDGCPSMYTRASPGALPSYVQPRWYHTPACSRSPVQYQNAPPSADCIPSANAGCGARAAAGAVSRGVSSQRRSDARKVAYRPPIPCGPCEPRTPRVAERRARSPRLPQHPLLPGRPGEHRLVVPHAARRRGSKPARVEGRLPHRAERHERHVALRHVVEHHPQRDRVRGVPRGNAREALGEEVLVRPEAPALADEARGVAAPREASVLPRERRAARGAALRDAACPISTGRETRRVHLVRGRGGGGYREAPERGGLREELGGVRPRSAPARPAPGLPRVVVAVRGVPPHLRPPPPPPPLVLSGHAASLTPY